MLPDYLKILRAPADAPGGAPSAAAVSTTAAASPAAAVTTGDAKATASSPGDAAAAAAKPAEAPKPTSILDTVKPPVDAKPEAKPGEAKAEEAKPAETPEAKAEREKAERDAKIADTLKTYDALKLPEGVEADQPVYADFKKAAAQHGLPTEAAQALIDTVAPKLKEAVEAPYKAWGEMQEKWIGEIKADPEIGGKNLEQNLGIVVKGIHALMGNTEAAQKVKEALAFTGAGNNPEIVRAFYRAGKLVSEGTPLSGKNAPAEKPRDIGSIMYPTMAKEGASA